MPDFAGEKTLDPTPHRRQQARREGHVAKSHDLGSAMLLLAGAGILMALGGGLIGFLVEFCRAQLGGEPWLTADATFVVGRWHATVWPLARYLLPILGLLCLAGVAANVLQVGWLFLPQRLALDLARLSPIEGLRRIFSGASVVRLGFGVVKLAIVGVVAGAVLWDQRQAILELAALAPTTIAGRIGHLVLWTVLEIGAALFALALLDYAFQWWKREQDLKMTPQELREELRNLEGNPQMAARRKQIHREIAGAAIARVPSADRVDSKP
jgi:flagellar biosynthesis protein FlhB